MASLGSIKVGRIFGVFFWDRGQGNKHAFPPFINPSFRNCIARNGLPMPAIDKHDDLPVFEPARKHFIKAREHLI